VTLTSGTLQICCFQIQAEFPSGSFNLVGTDFAAIGRGNGGPATLGSFSDGSNISVTLSVFPAHFGNTGSVTAGGQTLVGQPSTNLEVTSGPLTLDGLVGTAGFSATGLVRLTRDPTLPDFLQEVAGTGTLELSGIRQPNGVILANSVTLTFEAPTPLSPTPEPGSLLLLGTGLTAVWLLKR
jgi:hypothetical protein